MGRFSDILNRVVFAPDIRAARERADALRRVEPLEGTLMSLYNSIIPNWWSENVHGSPLIGTPTLAERVWVAERCQALNSQQIASMPLRWHGPAGVDEPAWVSSPDPNWFPNGIGDAMYAIVDNLYRFGYAILWVTAVYSSGYPRNWTVLDSGAVQIKAERGARVYKFGEEFLDPARVVQIDRNPTTKVHGTSALRAYAQNAYSLLAAGNQSLSVSEGGIPAFYLAAENRVTKEQAETLQEQWMAATSRRNGAPPVVPPGIKPTEMSFKPADLALLDTQKWNSLTIATAYGIPGVMLNMALEGSLTYQNPGELGEQWWRFELRPTGTRIVNAFSAQMLPRGQWISLDAADTFAPLTELSDDDDAQASQVSSASPAQQPRQLTAIGGGG